MLHQDNHDEKLANAVQEYLAPFTIVLVRLARVGGKEDAQCIGSGTLVTIGERGGILTASHVVDAIARESEIGILRFPTIGSQSQSLRVRFEKTHVFDIGGRPYGPSGPDIAFVPLASDDRASLNVRNSFFNLDKRRDAVLAGNYDRKPFFDTVVGTVDEKTTSLVPTYAGGPSVNFQGIMERGTTRPLASHSGFDLLRFDPETDPAHFPITSYGGVSGGGLWRAFLTKIGDGAYQFDSGWLLGLAFYEGPSASGIRPITCHGPLSVYGRLFDLVTAT